MLLNDKEIKEQCKKGMINPYLPKLVNKINDQKTISYGQSSFGYDIRLSPSDVKIFRGVPNKIVDPKNFSELFLEDQEVTKIGDEKYFVLPAFSYSLGVSVEEFKIPNDITAICLGKSTYARCGVLINVTPLEAGWRGFLTIEISNISSSAVKIYLDEGIAQLLFFRGNLPELSYNDRNGKYQGQAQKVIFPR